MVNSESPYSTYYKTSEADVRIPAAREDDRKRRMIDSWLFRGYAKEIVFAALSLNEGGLTSYGNGEIVAILKDEMIELRSTLLEMNSYDFANKYFALDKPVPPGHKSNWANRHMLATAKLYGKIEPGMNESEYADILLHSNGSRNSDDFMEVHIYGPILQSAFSSVKFSISPTEPHVAVEIELVKLKLAENGVAVTGN
jgi:hypothetical protein